MANSADPDQTAPQGSEFLLVKLLCLNYDV